MEGGFPGTPRSCKLTRGLPSLLSAEPSLLQGPKLTAFRAPFCGWNKQQACFRSFTSSGVPPPVNTVRGPIWAWSGVPVAGAGRPCQALGSQCGRKGGGRPSSRGGILAAFAPGPLLLSRGSFEARHQVWSSRVTEGWGGAPLGVRGSTPDRSGPGPLLGRGSV